MVHYFGRGWLCHNLPDEAIFLQAQKAIKQCRHRKLYISSERTCGLECYLKLLVTWSVVALDTSNTKTPSKNLPCNRQRSATESYWLETSSTGLGRKCKWGNQEQRSTDLVCFHLRMCYWWMYPQLAQSSRRVGRAMCFSATNNFCHIDWEIRVQYLLPNFVGSCHSINKLDQDCPYFLAGRLQQGQPSCRLRLRFSPECLGKWT